MHQCMEPAAPFTLPVQPCPTGQDRSLRQASNCPWAYQVSSAVVQRARSNPGGTPGRLPSAPATSASRGAIDSPLLSSVRKQMEAFEEKVNSQVTRLQTQNERLRDAAFSRLEEKLSLTEGSQPKVERRLAELTGNVRGLSDELHSQIRRIDELDHKIWDWKQELDEGFGSKILEIQQTSQQSVGAQRIASQQLEDLQRRGYDGRLQALDCKVQDLVVAMARAHSAHEDASQHLMTLQESHSRHAEDLSQLNLLQQAPDNVTGFLENRVRELAQRCEGIVQDSLDVGQRLEQAEERLGVVRQRQEDGQHRDELQKSRQMRDEVLQALASMRERLETLESWREKMRLEEHVSQAFSPRLDSMRASPTPVAELVAHESLQRMDELESKIAMLESDLSSRLELDINLEPRVGEMLQKLHDMVPKIAALDADVRNLKTGQLDHHNTHAETKEQLAHFKTDVELRHARIPEMDALRAEFLARLTQVEDKVRPVQNQVIRLQQEVQLVGECFQQSHNVTDRQLYRQDTKVLKNTAETAAKALALDEEELAQLLMEVRSDEETGYQSQQRLFQQVSQLCERFGDFDSTVKSLVEERPVVPPLCLDQIQSALRRVESSVTETEELQRKMRVLPLDAKSFEDLASVEVTPHES